MDLKVFITTTDASCSECGEQLDRHAWITLVENKGALCLSCADLEHLVFLASGDAAAVELAVSAHIRHVKTEYDALLAKGYERWEARNQVQGAVDRVLAQWKAPE